MLGKIFIVIVGIKTEDKWVDWLGEEEIDVVCKKWNAFSSNQRCVEIKNLPKTGSKHQNPLCWVTCLRNT